MKKTLLSFFVLTLFCLFELNATNYITLGSTNYRIDTLAYNKVGPGSYYTSLDLVNSTGQNPLKVFFLDVDATNPYVKFNAVLSNDTVGGNERTSAMAIRRSKEKELYFGGTNGDFYSTTAPVGIPVHGHIDNGSFGRLPTNTYHAIVDSLNHPYIDVPTFTGKLIYNNTDYVVTGVNTTRGTNNLVVYTDLKGAKTGTNNFGTELVVQLTSGWKVNAPVKGKVVASYLNQGNNPLQKGYFILSGHGTSQTILNQIQVGDEVTLNLGLSLQDYAVNPGVVAMVGGDRIILQNGVITDNDWVERNPRTSFGYSQDYSRVIFCVVDGRSSISVGISTKMLGQLMQLAGAYNAINLDGGGSSALYVNKLGVMNVTSDGTERAVANGIYAVATSPTDNVVTEIRNIKQKIKVPRYGVYQPQFFGYNQYGVLIDTNVQGVQLSVDPAVGEILANGNFLASGTQKGTIYATYNAANTTIQVDFADEAPVKIRLDSVLLDNNVKYPIEVQANVEGKYMNILPSALTWQVENPAVCEVIDGVVQGIVNGSTFVIGSLGAFKDTIRVDVEVSPTPILTAKAFTDDGWTFSSTNVTNVTHTPESTGIKTNYTYAAGRNTNITYTNTFPFYSLPDTFKIKFNPGYTNISKVVMRFRENNGGINSINKEFTGFALNVDNTISLPLDKLMKNPTDRGAYPLYFNYIQFLLNSVGMVAGQQYNIDINEFVLVYDKVVTSVENPKLLSKIRVYPNPVKDGISNVYLNLEGTEDVRIDVIGQNGQIYRTKRILNMQTGEVKIPLDGLNKGIYLVKITCAKETESVKIILK